MTISNHPHILRVYSEHGLVNGIHRRHDDDDDDWINIWDVVERCCTSSIHEFIDCVSPPRLEDDVVSPLKKLEWL